MKQLLILMLLLFPFALSNAQNGQPKAPAPQTRINFAEQEAIVKKFTSSFDSLTPLQKSLFFTNVKHIMDPEVTKIESGVVDSDPPSDAIVLFNGKDLGEWEEVTWGPGGPGGKKPITVAATWQSYNIQEYLDQGIVNNMEAYEKFYLILSSDFIVPFS